MVFLDAQGAARVFSSSPGMHPGLLGLQPHEDRMSEIPEGLRYTPKHEYVQDTDVEGEVLIGITDYAQGELGDVVYIAVSYTHLTLPTILLV